MPVFVPAPAPGLGYGGAEYGYSPYGSGSPPRPPWTVSGGYGGYPYGNHSYGSVDVIPPRVTSVTSIDGNTVEVFFSEAMKVDAALLAAVSYTFAALIGAPATVTSVVTGVLEDGGATSVVLTHTGTTLGGRYQLTVATTLVDVVGNPILATARTAVFLSLGRTPEFAVVPTDGSHIRLDFDEDILPEADFTPGVEDINAYGIETDYPVPLTVTAAAPVVGNPDQVLLTVEGMTSATYDLTVSPADAVIYDGTYLPSAATTFTGTVVGTGTSTAGVSGLLLSKAAGVTYGWNFADTSGKVLPSSSFRVDLTVDASAATYAPALFDATLGALVVSDGAVQVTLTFLRVAGVYVIEVTSGAFLQQVPAAWNSGEMVVTLLRNQKADHYAVLLDGVPVVSAATVGFTGVPTILPGARFTLGPSYAVTQFPLRALTFTASQTVFSASWNFLHGVTFAFVGSTALTRPSLLTKRGPLVKDWGDPTPATKLDVEVRVNSVAVAIESVNPYVGLITPTIPIPLTSPGSTTVEVDYIWFPNPAMEMVGLNTLGLVLNKWDLHQGHTSPPTGPFPPGHLGAPDRQRFPMGLVLAPIRRQRPILIGHRYIGFEKAYTAALNSPTTLLLNQNPHAIARDTLSDSPEPVSISYEGDVTPVGAEDPWVLEGTDSGHVGTDADAGFYILIDDSAGAYGVGTSALYVRQEDLSFPASGNQAARVQVREWVSDGVFTGVAFGHHNNRHLFMVGFLEINGVKHVGLIRDATRPHLTASWTIGPAIAIRITSSTTFTTTSSAFATTQVSAGDIVFQILDGPQAGVYTVADCGIEIDGDTATVTIVGTDPFPADPSLWGNRDATAYIEVRWDEAPLTYRLVTDVEAGAAQVFVGGALSGLAISTTKVASFPAQTTLLLPTTRQGAFFWGSTSRIATNESAWGFVRYGITYNQATFHFQGIVVAAEMSDLPDADANHEWFVTEDSGYAVIDSSGDTLLLKSTANSSDTLLDTTFGYGRLEPFLTHETLVDVDSTFRVDTGTLGAGDAQIRMQNGEKSVLFSTILYAEGGSPFRRIASLASVSITGFRDPEADGWTKSGTGTLTVQERYFVLTQAVGLPITYTKVLAADANDADGRIFEGRFTVQSHGTLTGGQGPFLAGMVERLAFEHDVGIVLQTTSQIRFVSGGTIVGAAVPFVWDDGQPHTYRLVCDPVAVTVALVVDDVVLATVALTIFTASRSSAAVEFGAYGLTSASVVEWESANGTTFPATTLKRTLGVLRAGGDPDNIDSWELPRTDTLDVPNSDASAVIEEMDWRSDIQVRVRLDPAWGVTVFRPDLPPPPYYTGDFATEFTEPSAGWINVEYRNLPRVALDQRFGRVTFGDLDPRSISQQRWSEVRYRIYTRSNEDFIAPQGMVLNRYNVITSGELLRDVAAEVVEVESVTTTLVSLSPAHIFANRVFSVVVNSVVLAPDAWTFDADTQVITLASPLPSEHTAVTVTFAAGKPVTNTYLCSQPLLQSTTLLNEDTPPIPASQIGAATREEVFGTALNDPTDTLGSIDFILNDPFQTVQFTDTGGVLYEALEFCTVDDGNDRNLLSVACDGPAPEEGWIEMALSGTSFSDGLSLPGGPAIWHGSSVARDTVGTFNQAHILFASGGNYNGGTLAPGTAILYPNYPSIPGPDRGAIVRAYTISLWLNSVFTSIDPDVEASLEDNAEIPNTADNVPPTYAGDGIASNPNGVAGVEGHGAAVAALTEYAATTYSRVGPWGGEVALAIRSQLYGASAAQPTGIPASGDGFVLSGGTFLGPEPTPSTFQIVAAN